VIGILHGGNVRTLSRKSGHLQLVYLRKLPLELIEKVIVVRRELGA
jgi:hypothetical protein